MSEFWIVTSKKYARHATLLDAVGERNALAHHFPEVRFFVHRCKASLHSARHFTKLVALLRDILEQGLTRDNAERAKVLLFTIGNRNEMPISPNAPIEWRAEAANGR